MVPAIPPRPDPQTTATRGDCRFGGSLERIKEADSWALWKAFGDTLGGSGA